MGYKAVDKEFEELIVIQKSKFITTLVPITSQEDAIEKLNIIKKKYSDATHNCYAYISSENAIEGIPCNAPSVLIDVVPE